MSGYLLALEKYLKYLDREEGERGEGRGANAAELQGKCQQLTAGGIMT